MKPEKRELFEQRHSRELILYDAAARYLKELKASGEEITPKEWRREIRPADRPETGGQHRHESHAGGTESRWNGSARPPTNWPGRKRDKPHDRGPEAVKGTAVLATPCRGVMFRDALYTELSTSIHGRRLPYEADYFYPSLSN